MGIDLVLAGLFWCWMLKCAVQVQVQVQMQLIPAGQAYAVPWLAGRQPESEPRYAAPETAGRWRDSGASGMGWSSVAPQLAFCPETLIFFTGREPRASGGRADYGWAVGMLSGGTR